MHVVPLAAQPPLVFRSQHGVHEDGTSKQANDKVSKDSAVAGIVLWLLPLDVDVRADDAVQISPANDNADDDTAFVNAFDVVAGPGQGVWNGRVNLESDVRIKVGMEEESVIEGPLTPAAPRNVPAYWMVGF